MISSWELALQTSWMMSISWYTKSLWNATAKFLAKSMIDANSDQKCMTSNSWWQNMSWFTL